MEPIAVCALFGVILCVFAPLHMKRRSVRRKYENMNDEELIRIKVNAERMWKFSLAIPILGPIPLSFIAAILKNDNVLEYFICLIILVVLGGIANFWFWWQIGTITKSELEIRENKYKGTRVK